MATEYVFVGKRALVVETALDREKARQAMVRNGLEVAPIYVTPLTRAEVEQGELDADTYPNGKLLRLKD